MLFLTPLVLAASAAAIVIPEISEDEENFFRALPVESEPITLPRFMLTRSLDVPCKKCPDSDTMLRLNFSIESGKRLTLNGFELYPNANPWQGDLVASAATLNGQAKEQKLGYSLSAMPYAESDDEMLNLIDIDFRIIEVGNHFVEDVPAVKVMLMDGDLFGDQEHGLVIFDLELDLDSGSNTSCDSMWCRAKGKAGDAWKKIKGGIKGCGGMRGHGHKGDHKGNHHKGNHKGDHKNPHARPGPMGHEKGNHKHGGHGKGGHHHHGGPKHHEDSSRRYSWGSMVKNVVSYILLPLILGITAGIGVAVLAMFVGSFAFGLFNHLWAGRCQAPIEPPLKVSALETVVEEDEKSGLMADQEPPPQYQKEDPSN